jgi:cation/acetate symporter
MKDAEISWICIGFNCYFIHNCSSNCCFQKTNLIETSNGKDYSSMPAWFTKWETTGLLTFEDKMAMGKFNITTTTQGRSIFSRPKEGNKGN